MKAADALEHAIAEDIDDEAAYQVWSDWLLERGDPLGELIATWLAIEDEPDATRRDAFRRDATAAQERLAYERVGAIDVGVDLELRFRFGLVRRIAVLRERRPDREPPADAAARIVDAVLSGASGGFVREIVVDGRFFAPLIDVLAARAPRALAAIVTCGSPADGLVPLAGLGALPRLARLDLVAVTPTFERTTLPACSDLVVPPDRAMLATLGVASLPRLAELTIEGRRLGPLQMDPLLDAATEQEVARAIGALPALRELRLGYGLLDLGHACARVAPQLEAIWSADVRGENLAAAFGGPRQQEVERQ